MTNPQKKYAMERVKEIAAIHFQKANDGFKYKHVCTEDVQSELDTLDRSLLSYERYDDWHGVTLRVPTGTPLHQRVQKIEKERCEKLKLPNQKQAAINAEVTTICDQIMLGDADEAMKLLEAFAKKEF